MINLYPNSYYYDDYDPSYSDPRLRRQLLRRAQLQRQAAMEDEQRRQMMRYERAMREERMRREAEARRRAAIIEQRRREEEMMRRQALEQSRRDAEKRRRTLERQWQQQRQRELELERQLELERLEATNPEMRQDNLLRRDAEYGIVRGPDGRLYRLNSDDRYGRDAIFGSAGPMLRGRTEKPMRSVVPPLSKSLNENELYSVSKSEESDSADEEVSDAPTERHANVSTKNVGVSDSVKKPNAPIARRRTKSAGKRSKSTKKKTVKSSVLIGDVEDASDSEQEDILTSVWRNRKPSDGEWMEPVKGYDVYW